MISPPEIIDSYATLLLKVSTEINALGNCFLVSSNIGITLFNSSSTLISAAPGRELYPPMSIISAPEFIIFSTCLSILSLVLYLPPSKKESGVTFKIPIIFGVEKFSRLPLIFIVIVIC